MSRLGPEWRGKLPPGAQEMMDRNLDSYREAEKSGLKIILQVLPPGPPWPCPIADKQADQRYTLDTYPHLPFEGCERSPCCGCCYIADASEL